MILPCAMTHGALALSTCLARPAGFTRYFPVGRPAGSLSAVQFVNPDELSNLLRFSSCNDWLHTSHGKATLLRDRYLARPAGLEPATPGLEGRCSIRLSYGRFIWSGQRDLNPRPPAPKAGALPDCAMPRGSLSLLFNSLSRKFSWESMPSPGTCCYTTIFFAPTDPFGETTVQGGAL